MGGIKQFHCLHFENPVCIVHPSASIYSMSVYRSWGWYWFSLLQAVFGGKIDHASFVPCPPARVENVEDEKIRSAHNVARRLLVPRCMEFLLLVKGLIKCRYTGTPEITMTRTTLSPRLTAQEGPEHPQAVPQSPPREAQEPVLCCRVNPRLALWRDQAPFRRPRGIGR